MSAVAARPVRRRYEMPVAPFQELLRKAMLEHTVEGLDKPEDYSTEGLMTPLESITERVTARTTLKYESVAKRLYEVLRGKVTTINFDLADAIVCATVGPFFWYTDDRVKDLYAQIGADL